VLSADLPYLSIVLASRNDGYAGGMLRRLEVCVNALVTQVERFALRCELIVVDWNPPARTELRKTVAWPTGLRHCLVRVITVPRHVHRRLPLAKRLPMLVHRARNVGARRAHGAFILPLSPDILFSDELVEWLARRELDPTALYRIARHDVPEHALDIQPHEARLRYCRDHVLQVYDHARSYRVPGLPALFTNAAGDFTLLSYDMYCQLHGLPEEREFHSMHFDSVFCFMAHAAGAREVVLSEPCRMYHVDHGLPSWRPQKSWLERMAERLPVNAKRARRLAKLARRIAPRRSRIDRSGVPHLDLSTPAGRAQYEGLIQALSRDRRRYNNADWGLRPYAFEEHVFGGGGADG
jgi:hypothetical protein